MSTILSILAAAEAAGEHAAEQAEEHHKSEAPFFIAGGLFALFAVLISVFGFRTPDFPSSERAARGVMVGSVVGWMAAVGMAIYVAL
ncbi:MAG: hypothetical protein ACRDKY_03715 [Solirubrobacteraceae bacterium]